MRGGLAGFSALDLALLGLLDSLGDDLVVLLSRSPRLIYTAADFSSDSASSLQTDRSDKSLDLGSLRVALVSSGDGSADDILADVILFAQVEQLADLRGSLGTKSSGLGIVSQSRDLLLALLHNNEVDSRHLGRDDASSDGLSLAFSLPSGTVARHASSQEQTDTIRSEDTLLHGKSLLVISSSDLEDVAGELLTEIFAIDFVGNSLLVETSTNTSAEMVKPTYSFRSSSISTHFCNPVTGYEMLSFI